MTDAVLFCSIGVGLMTLSNCSKLIDDKIKTQADASNPSTYSIKQRTIQWCRTISCEIKKASSPLIITPDYRGKSSGPKLPPTTNHQSLAPKIDGRPPPFIPPRAIYTLHLFRIIIHTPSRPITSEQKESSPAR